MTIVFKFAMGVEVHVKATKIAGTITAYYVGDGSMEPQYRVEYLDKDNNFCDRYFSADRLELVPQATTQPPA